LALNVVRSDRGRSSSLSGLMLLPPPPPLASGCLAMCRGSTSSTGSA